MRPPAAACHGDDVVGRVERGVDPSPPRLASPLGCGSSKSSGSQYAFRIRWKLQAFAPQLGAERQAVRAVDSSRAASASRRATRSVACSQHVGQADALRARASASRSSRRAMSRLHEAMHVGVLLEQRPVEPARSRCPGSRRCCCRAACGAPRRPSGSSACRATAASPSGSSSPGGCAASRSPGSSVGPSTPQFQLRLSSAPSRLSSPLASLCFCVVGDEIVQREAVVAGHEVDARLRLRAACGRRSRGCRAAGRPARRPCRRSPRKKLRTSSRKRPFHSFQASPTKLPTWYRPAASQPRRSAWCRRAPGPTRCPTAPADSAADCPDASRERIDARSKRKPSTCISSTQ